MPQVMRWWVGLRRASYSAGVGVKTTTIQALVTRYMRQGQLALEYRFYASGRHEILNEAEKGRVHRDVGHWLHQFLDEPTTEV